MKDSIMQSSLGILSGFTRKGNQMKKVIKKLSPIPRPLNNCDKKIEKALEEKGRHNFSGYYYI